jgi:hypothetical protein
VAVGSAVAVAVATGVFVGGRGVGSAAPQPIKTSNPNVQNKTFFNIIFSLTSQFDEKCIQATEKTNYV